VRRAATASSRPWPASAEASGSPNLSRASEKQEEGDGPRRQQRGVDDQRLGRRVQFGGFVDRERKGLRHRQLVVVLCRCVARGVEHLRRGRGEAPVVLGERDFEPLAIGGGLLMGERQAT